MSFLAPTYCIWRQLFQQCSIYWASDIIFFQFQDLVFSDIDLLGKSLLFILLNIYLTIDRKGTLRVSSHIILTFTSIFNWNIWFWAVICRAERQCFQRVSLLVALLWEKAHYCIDWAGKLYTIAGFQQLIIESVIQLHHT